MECRIGRFHNIYGPFGTWKGGREKAPAAFCRKAITSTKEFEMWGNGKQTRSFCYIDDCVEVRETFECIPCRPVGPNAPSSNVAGHPAVDGL